jgi:hypothetical protein
MPNEPGHFQFDVEPGPTGVPLVSWALINDLGDVVAVSFGPRSGKSAKAQVQWIIDHAHECRIIDRVARSRPR